MFSTDVYKMIKKNHVQNLHVAKLLYPGPLNLSIALIYYKLQY